MGSASPRARTFLLFLVIATSVLVAVVAAPIASALFAAIVAAAVLWPVQRRLSRVLRQRKQLSAALLTIAVVLVLLVPTLTMSAFVIDEGSQGVEFVSDTVRSEGVSGLIDRMPTLPREIAHKALDFLPQRQTEKLDETVKKEVAAQSRNAALVVGAALSATGAFLFQTTMFLIAFFFLLVDGTAAVDWLESVSPLRENQTRELLAEFKQVSYAVVASTLITSAIQAAAALVGYLIAGVPHPLFFTVLTFVIAFIPAVGAASVAELAALLLYFSGHQYAALFLSLWGFVVVALIDNVAKPFIMKDDVEMPGAIVFFALIGGLAAFGAIGLLVGPLAVAFFLTVMRMYRRDFPRAA